MVTEFLEKESVTLEDIVNQVGSFHFEEPLSKEIFIKLAERFPDLRMEREADGKVFVMSPVKKGSGRRESKLLILLGLWHAQFHAGELFGSSAGFDLPDGSSKAPDVAWISNERLSMDLSGEEDFIHAVPDFIAEIRSSSDRIKNLQKKMTGTWLANGVRLGWLIDPYEEKVYIYRPGREVEIVKGFDGKMLSGEDVLPGFELALEEMKRKG